MTKRGLLRRARGLCAVQWIIATRRSYNSINEDIIKSENNPTGGFIVTNKTERKETIEREEEDEMIRARSVVVVVYLCISHWAYINKSIFNLWPIKYLFKVAVSTSSAFNWNHRFFFYWCFFFLFRFTFWFIRGDDFQQNPFLYIYIGNRFRFF